MLITNRSNLMVENSDEIYIPLSLSCAAQNFRMAAFYSDKARNLLEHAALAVESSDTSDLTSHIVSAGKYQAYALHYSSIAKAMIT